MQKEKLHELEFTPVKELVMRYFWPSFIGVMANTLYNIVDRIFIGQAIGAEALSGVTAVFPVMMIMTAFGMLIGLGSSVQLSISLGQKNMDKAKSVLGNAVIMVFVISLLVTGVGYMIKDPMLRLFGATDTTIGYASDYINIILWGVVFHEFGFSINALIRAEGNAKAAMYSMLISAGINIPLDALFIIKLDMGVKGAALATIFSMITLCIWVLAHFRSKRCLVPLQSRFLKVNKNILLPIIAIGISPFLMQVAHSVVQALFNLKLISHSGDLAVGAMGIINSVIVLISTSVMALNMSSQPIIGFNYGAHNYARVKQTLKFGLVLATIICFFSWVLVQLFPETIIRGFNNDPKLIQIGVMGMRMFTLMLPIIGFQMVLGNYFQSVGKAKTAIIISLLRQVIVLIPMVIILPHFFGINGIWLSSPISDFISAFVAAYFLFHEWKRLNVQANTI